MLNTTSIELSDQRVCVHLAADGLTSLSDSATNQFLASLCENIAEVYPTFDLVDSDQALAQTIGLNRYYTLVLKTDASIEETLDCLQQQPSLIENAEPDLLVQPQLNVEINDPYYSMQWSLENVGQNIDGVSGLPGADIGAQRAWTFTTGKSSVIVAVVDSGVSNSHPDLAGKLVPGKNFTINPADDNTDDGLSNSHGTYCAGVIAAEMNNTLGITGIAPNVRIMPIKVLSSSGYGSETACGNGLIWAADHGASVINISLGYYQGSTAFRDAVIYADSKGCLIAAASGNTTTNPVAYPAKWSRCIAVGSTNNRDELSVFSTQGPEVDIAAPGENILTTADTSAIPDGYSYQTGTSLATPMVSAAAALCKSANRFATATDIKSWLYSSALDLGAAGIDPQFGAGRLRVDIAVQSASLAYQYKIADWNGNSIVDVSDIFAFINAWFAGSGDADGDGFNAYADIFVFLRAWYSSYY